MLLGRVEPLNSEWRPIYGRRGWGRPNGYGSVRIN